MNYLGNLSSEETMDMDISNNIEDSSTNDCSSPSPIRHEDIMDILTNNEVLAINPDSQDEVDPDERDSETEELVKVVDNNAVSSKTELRGT